MEVSALMQLVKEHYAIGTPTRIELLAAGHNDTYLVEAASGPYALRVYGPTKTWISGPGDYQFELDLLTHLHQQQAPVSWPVQRRGGDLLGQLPTPAGDRSYALFSWAAGQPVEEWTADIFQRLGAALAAVHRASDTFESQHDRYRIDHELLLDRSLRRMRPQLQRADPADAEFIRDQAQLIKAQLQAFDPGPGGWGVIHGDPQTLNCHITDQDLTLFDFDHCGFGWRAYDIAYALRHTGPQGDPDAEHLRTSLTEGYHAIRPLNPAERQMLPTLGRAAWIREGTAAGHGLPTRKLKIFLNDPYAFWQ